MLKVIEAIGVVMLLCAITGAAIGLTAGTAIVVAQWMGVEL